MTDSLYNIPNFLTFSCEVKYHRTKIVLLSAMQVGAYKQEQYELEK